MGWKSEMMGIVVSVVLPLLISLVPFYHNMYGLAGAWCWIKVNRGQNCNETSIGVGYQIGLFYAPVVLLAILSLSVSSVTFFSFLKSTRARHLAVNRQLQMILVKGALALLIYPVVYNIIHIFPVVNRLNYLVNTVPKGSQPLSWLWIVHAVLPPLIPLAVLGSFVLQPDILKKIRHERADHAAQGVELQELKRHTDTTLNSDAGGQKQSTTIATEYEVTGDNICSDYQERPLIIRSVRPEGQKPPS